MLRRVIQLFPTCHITALALAALLYALPGDSWVCAANVDVAQLKNEAPSAWAKIAERSQRLEIIVIDKRFSRGAEIQRIEWHNKYAGLNRLITRNNLATPKDSGSQQVMCQNSRYSFDVRKTEQDLPWVVRHVGKEPNVDFERFGANVFSTPQLYLGDEFLPSLFARNSFVISKVESANRGFATLVSVTFEYQPADETEKSKTAWTLRSGVVILNPARFWAIEEYRVQCISRSGTLQEWSQKNEFIESPLDSPFLSRREQIRYVSADARDNWIWDFALLQERVIPEEEFTLAAYGLPEIDPPSRFAFVPRWAILAATGIICIAIGFWLFQRRHAT